MKLSLQYPLGAGLNPLGTFPSVSGHTLRHFLFISLKAYNRKILKNFLSFFSLLCSIEPYLFQINSDWCVSLFTLILSLSQSARPNVPQIRLLGDMQEHIFLGIGHQPIKSHYRRIPRFMEIPPPPPPPGCVGDGIFKRKNFHI